MGGEFEQVSDLYMYSRADKLSYEQNCAFCEESMNLLPLLAHIIRFNFRCGGKLYLTSDDLERSLT